MTPRIVGFRVAWVALVGLWCGSGGALVGLWWSLGVALGWLWSGFGFPIGWLSVGFGVALGWLCIPESMPSICLWGGFEVALSGLSVQGPRPSTLGHRPLQTLRFSVARRGVGLLGCFRWNRDSSPRG